MGQTDSTVSLRWSATGDDGHHGRTAARYRLAPPEAPLAPDTFDQAPFGLDAPARQGSGHPEVATLPRLERGTRYGSRSWPKAIVVIARDLERHRDADRHAAATGLRARVDACPVGAPHRAPVAHRKQQRGLATRHPRHRRPARAPIPAGVGQRGHRRLGRPRRAGESCPRGSTSRVSATASTTPRLGS